MQNMLKAIEAATKAHGGVMRKYIKPPVPYMVHPVRVMHKVAVYLETVPSGERFRHMAEDLLITCALHDVPEDRPDLAEAVRREFGEVIWGNLLWLTNISKRDPEIAKLKRQQRKEADREHLRGAPDHCKIIKMCDRTDNLLDMLDAPPDFVLDWYVPESRELLPILAPADVVLGGQMLDAINWIESVTKGKT